MSTLTVSPRSAAPPADRPVPPDAPSCPMFEHQLRQAGARRQHEDTPTDTPPPATDWSLLPPPAFARDIAPPDPLAGEGLVPVTPSCVPPAADVAPPPGGPRAPATAAPSRVFDQLAAPLQAAAGHGRFEVLNGAAVTGIAIDPAGPGGRAEVSVVAPAAQAAVLVHHLPQLQRRLADRVTARVRVGDGDPEQER